MLLALNIIRLFSILIRNLDLNWIFFACLLINTVNKMRSRLDNTFL